MQRFVDNFTSAISRWSITGYPQLVNVQQLTDVTNYLVLIFFSVVGLQTLKTPKSGNDVTHQNFCHGLISDG